MFWFQKTECQTLHSMLEKHNGRPCTFQSCNKCNGKHNHLLCFQSEMKRAAKRQPQTKGSDASTTTASATPKLLTHTNLEANVPAVLATCQVQVETNDMH